MNGLNYYAPAIQAITAVVVVLLTGVLAWSTMTYARDTRRALDLACQQFHREWVPDVRIANVQRIGPEQVQLSVVNLARPAALVKLLKIGTGGRSEQGIEPQGIEAVPLYFLVAGGQISESVAIHQELGKYRLKYNPPPEPRSGSFCQIGLNVALVYDCAGAERQTPWIYFSAEFRDHVVTSLRRFN